MGAAPWNRLLGLYKRLQKGAMAKVRGAPARGGGRRQGWARESASVLPLLLSARGPGSGWGPGSGAPLTCGMAVHPQFPLKEGLPREEPGEEEAAAAEEDSALKLCVPGVVTLQSPLHKAFRSTDTVGGCAARTPSPRPSPALMERLSDATPVNTTRGKHRT